MRYRAYIIYISLLPSSMFIRINWRSYFDGTLHGVLMNGSDIFKNTDDVTKVTFGGCSTSYGSVLSMP